MHAQLVPSAITSPVVSMPIDLSEFPSVNKADWLRQVTKDLKGRALEDFDWSPAPGLAVTPFVHADDFAQFPAPLQSGPSRWEICEAVDATDPAMANRQLLEALEYGAEGLELYLPATVDADHLGQTMNGVYLDLAGLHFTGPGVVRNPGAVLANLQKLAARHQCSPAALHGSLAYDPVTQASLVDWRYLIDLVDFARAAFPGFRLVMIGTQDTLPNDPVEELVRLLRQGNFYLQKLTERGLSVADVASIMQFSMITDKNYFLEIAKIRAFKILWLNVLQGWGAPLDYPDVAARFSPAAYTEDLYTNMIRATTMAMSAVLGGADRLTVLPYDTGREGQATYSPTFSRRMARNVQHLLKMESGLDEAADPAAGSYYLEKLTGQLSSAAWNRFVHSD